MRWVAFCRLSKKWTFFVNQLNRTQQLQQKDLFCGISWMASVSESR
jgi:hypothetical protein